MSARSQKTVAADREPVREPAYVRLAGAIKHMIASGEYQPGSKIPSELAISRAYGLSPMTVRQAVGILVEQGLLRRVHGSGTYVRRPDWIRANFTLEGLLELLHDGNGTSIKIIKAAMAKARAKAAVALEVNEGSPIITMMRLVSHAGRPFLLNRVALRFDPKSPIVESELEVSSLSGLFTGQGNGFIKKAKIEIEPCLLSPAEAAYLKVASLAPAFKINYIFYGYGDSPVGSGWFLAPKKAISLSAKIGVWDD